MTEEAMVLNQLSPQNLLRSAARDGPAMSHEVRVEFWTRVLIVRWSSVVILGLLFGSLASPDTERFLWVSAVIGLSSVESLWLLVRVLRKGDYPKASVWADHLVGLALITVWPASYAWVLIVLAVTTPVIVIGFSREVATAVLAVFAIPFLLVGWQVGATGWKVTYLTWLLLGLSAVYTISVVANEERAIRGRYTNLLERTEVAIWESPGPGKPLTYINERVESLFGHAVERWIEPGFWEALIHPDDVGRVVAAWLDDAQPTSRELEYRIRHADGRYLWVLERAQTIIDETGRILGTSGVLIDINERRHAEQELKTLGQFVDEIPIALQILQFDDPTDATTLRTLAVNRSARRLRALSGDPLLNEKFAYVARIGTPLTIDEHPSVDATGATRWSRVIAIPLPDRVVGVTIEDVTDRVEALEGIRHQALHDALTGLANRALLRDRLTGALAAAGHNDDHVALLVMDLNQFKEVNDALGHHHGDRLLVELGHRITSVVRSCDTVARLGGDEFAVLLSNDTSPRAALETARRIAQSFTEPIEIDGVSLQTGVSIGIAVAPTHGTDPELLTQRADIAMYKAKSTGIGVSLYVPDHDQSAVRRLTLISELRRGIDTDQFVVHYQPRICLRTARILDVEALVRWQHPVHGLLPPDEFIELAEVSGVIQPLTERVVSRATADVAALARKGLGLGVAVNLSVRNLYDPGLVDAIRTSLAASGLDATRLRTEITESELMDDPAVALAVLGQLRDMGIEISIDDFGTGYSSLSYLRDLPITEIKIDRTFVEQMSSGDEVLARSIIELAHNLGLGAVAEGVESGPALAQLASFGCDSAQGYFIARPMPIEELETFLRSGGDHYRQWIPGATSGSRHNSFAGAVWGQ